MTDAQYHVERLRGPDAPDAPPEGLAAGASARGVNGATLGAVFQAPWRAVSLVELEPGAALGPRDLDASEAMVYVTRGEGIAHLGHGPVALREGVALTLFRGERLHLEASAELELFFAEMATERSPS